MMMAAGCVLKGWQYLMQVLFKLGGNVDVPVLGDVADGLEQVRKPTFLGLSHRRLELAV